MTAVTVLLCLVRVVEAACPMSRNTAEQVGVVMILATQKLFVMIERKRQVDLVAGRAEIGRLVKVLQERLLVQSGLRLD